MNNGLRHFRMRGDFEYLFGGDDTKIWYLKTILSEKKKIFCLITDI